ncbi:MAG: hypothetical protein ABI693_07195 [Bryobacteraceae bacterium]
MRQSHRVQGSANHFFTKFSTLLTAGLLSLLPQLAFAQTDSLHYFKNYFVTGDYAVAGVGLRGQGVNGFATGTIYLNGVPKGADVIAAFLYWQTVETTSQPSSVNGFFRGNAIVGLALGDPNNAACSSSGGGTAPSGSSGRVYRADVLRYLPIDSVNDIRVANGAHSVKLPDSGGRGNGNPPFTNGASLVVIYRILGNTHDDLTSQHQSSPAPLRSVVIYDGAFTASKTSPPMSQLVGGFYQAADDDDTRMTQMVGNGLPGFHETVRVNGLSVGINPIFGRLGPRWDNPTFDIRLDKNASSMRTDVTSDGCLTWSAVVTSTKVVDTDRDGLLDVWETKGLHLNPGTATTAATFGGCSDYPTEACVNLPAMGAINGTRDVFVEMDWMHGTSGNDHSHQPKLDALTEVANTFKNHGIRLHFDVGNNYQTLATGPDFFAVPSAYAQGGEVVEESSLVCQTSPCTYTVPYAVVGYKKGFVNVKEGDTALGIPAHFARNRKDVFHYALWGHALSGPFDPATGKPTTTEPISTSGAGDRPGGDLLITLGLWRSDIPENDQVGSSVVQAGTLMHELGHNLGLSHAGLYRTPNCMPNYPSVMNYLYQARGLTSADGSTHVDYSPGTLAGVNEKKLSETASLGALNYRIRYYGPVGPLDPPNSAAQLLCDGSPITGGVPMIRLENTFTNFLDWNHDGKSTSGSLSLDVNYSGKIGDGVNGGPLYLDSNDWGNLNLQQVGARLNVNGLSTDVGAIDLGAIDLGAIDLGAIDLGAIDLGAIDLGAIDLGDINYETAVLSTVASPPPPSPDCPTCGLLSTNKIDRITLQWTAPDTGSVSSYNIYRSSAVSPTPTFLKSVPGGQAATTADDIVNGTTTLYNTAYTYYVTTVVVSGSKIVESSPSNTATGIVKRLFVAGLNLSRVYLDPNPAVLFTVTGMDLPAPAGVTCLTLATPTSDVGSYPITCSGPATTSNVVNGITYTGGTLTITPRPQTINFGPLANKTYGDAPFALTATATSSLAVGYTATGNCTVITSTVTLTGAGSCTIRASQPGNLNYLPALDVVQSFDIMPGQPAGFSYPDFNSIAGLTLNGQTTTAGGALRLTSVPSQNSSTWYSQPQAVTNAFTTTFQFRATPTSTPAADGFAFVIQKASVNAIGASGLGGYLGYEGIAGSLAVEFDTYLNSDFADPNANHVAIQSGGTGANTSTHGPATLAMNSSLPFTIADSAVHTAVIVYASGVLTVTVDGTTLVTANVNIANLLGLSPGGTAWVGFTAATGSNSENSDILSWSMQTN